MTRLAMSTAGTALFRALLARCGSDRNRILLTDCRSTDWQSLTFIGERHEMRLRILGPTAEHIYRAMTSDLGASEFAVSRQILADIAVFGNPTHESDGSISFGIEALTIEE